MLISELVKELLEMQKDHGDLEVYDGGDEMVIGLSYYEAEEEGEPAFIVMETS